MRLIDSDARKKAGWTQADVARMIGVSQPSVALLEIGHMNLEKFSKRAELGMHGGYCLD